MTTKFDPRYLEFFHLFNREEFFEAHEVLELLWRETQTSERDFYQGLIQLAAAFVHVQRNNPKSAAELYEKAAKRLKAYPDSFQGLQISEVLGGVEQALKTPGSFSKIKLPQPA